MISLIIPKISRCWSVNQSTRILEQAKCFQVAYSSFTVRDVFHETSDETGTLVTRFAKHIAMERSKSDVLVPTTVRYSDYFPITEIFHFEKELRKTPADQMFALILFASTYRPNADPVKYVRVLNAIDEEALKQIPAMSEETILQTLYSFLFLIPNWITRTEFYVAAVKRLVDDHSTSCTSKERFLQICFYLGLNKKSVTSRLNATQLLGRILSDHLSHYLPQLSTMDLAIVSNSAYKTATPVKNEAFEKRLVDEVLTLPLDSSHDAIFITFIKTMRFLRIQSEEVCQRILDFCTNQRTLQQLRPVGQVHLFAFLAENLWDDIVRIKPLVDAFMYNLEVETTPGKGGVRCKDIGTFLWCCARLNYPLTPAELKTIESAVLERVFAEEFKYFPDQLVDSCLSLWSLGHRSRPLLQHSVKLKAEARSHPKRPQPKVDSRLTVLLSAAQIEEPTWTSNLAPGFEAFNLNAKMPPHLSTSHYAVVDEYTRKWATEKGITSAKTVCPINGINIPGIHVESDEPFQSQVFVELLTPTQTLHFSREPLEIERLKIRLLRALGHKVKVLNTAELPENCNIHTLIFNTEVRDDAKETVCSVSL